jgi:hypothetical protein
VTLAEAQKLRSEIAEAEKQVKALKAQIRHREGRLRRAVVDAFNEASDALDGMTAETREIELGSTPCEVSPIGVCAYDERVVPLAQQRDRDLENRCDACLFCNVLNPNSRWRRS